MTRMKLAIASEVTSIESPFEVAECQPKRAQARRNVTRGGLSSVSWINP